MEEINLDKEKKNSEVLNQNSTLKEKLTRLEEKFIDSEIDFEIYQKHKQKISQELAQILNALNRSFFQKSNLCIYIDIFLEIASISPIIWMKGSSDARKKLLKMLFPQGIIYDKKNRATSNHWNELDI
jgi:site-specific DNA recombinase